MATTRPALGRSESAYNARDLELTYQYSNFGVPGLGLKRGLGEKMAWRLMRPRSRRWSIRGRRNIRPFRGMGARGRYGFYEALDYTPARVPEGKASRSSAPSWPTIRA